MFRSAILWNAWTVNLNLQHGISGSITNLICEKTRTFHHLLETVTHVHTCCLTFYKVCHCELDIYYYYNSHYLRVSISLPQLRLLLPEYRHSKLNQNNNIQQLLSYSNQPRSDCWIINWSSQNKPPIRSNVTYFIHVLVIREIVDWTTQRSFAVNTKTVIARFKGSFLVWVVFDRLLQRSIHSTPTSNNRS